MVLTIDSITSLLPYASDIVLSSLPKPGSLGPTLLGFAIPAAIASSALENNQPSLSPRPVNLSYICTFAVCDARSEAVVITEVRNVFSSPSSFLITSGSSSPV